MRHKYHATGLLIGLILGMLPSSVGSAQSTSVFSDVTTDSNYSQAIQYLKENKIIQGYSDGTFAPSKSINRAEFIKILIGSINDKPQGKNCFSDVQDQWFAPYVCQAKQLGVIEGYHDGSYKPDQEINFAEAAKIIANTYKLNKGGKDSSVWFKEYIEALQKEKAIPLSVEYFDEKITRDEMSEIIWRIKSDIQDKSSRTYQELNGEGLVKASSCADLEERYKQLKPIYRGPMLYKDTVDMITTSAVPAAAEASGKSSSMTNASADYSTTNLQEQGVDEADVIKNDGKYIYLIKDNTIRIVEAYPANNLKELITFELGPKDENFYPNEMYVDGDQLTVIGSASVNYLSSQTGTTSSAKMIAPYYNNYRTKVYIVNIQDRSKPKVVRTVDFDGNYSTSRKVGSTLYMVMNQYPYYDMYPMYRSATDQSTTTNSESISTNFADYLPKMHDSRDNQEALISPCADIRLMPRPKTFNYLITAAIPLDNVNQEVSRNIIIGSGDNVYSSENNLYVAATDWNGPYYYHLGQSDTKIYRFALNKGKIEYAADGLVPGTVLNQFSMDEHAGEFRIVTTQDDYTGKTKTSNNLFVLDSTLKAIGKITNIATGEKLYSARFMGDRAYLVTFKNVDPLFVVDLKDGKNPKILGQLKVPGYSDYLHPYDENHLIGFGKDVDPAEVEKDQSFVYYTAVRGFKMAMFDVTDPTNPKEMFKEIIGDQGTYSDLLNNHKALLFDKSKNLLAFPITVTEMPKQETPVCSNFTYSTCPSTCQKVCQPTCTYENGITTCNSDCNGANSCQSNTWVYPKNVFVGAYVYGVDLQKGFQLKAKITHLDQEGITNLLKQGYADYEKTIQRILYIGDSLYTVSQGGVKANSLSDLRELNFIKLAGSLYNITYGSSVTPVAN